MNEEKENQNTITKTDKVTEKIMEDKNYFYICITKQLNMTSQNEVVITSRKEKDDSFKLIEKARSIIKEIE